MPISGPPLATILRSDAGYPAALREYPSRQAPEAAHALGNMDMLRQRTLAFSCSSRCPGDVISRTLDLRKVHDHRHAACPGDFRLPPDSEVFSKLPGFEPIPFEQIGLIKDALRPALPEEPWPGGGRD